MKGALASGISLLALLPVTLARAESPRPAAKPTHVALDDGTLLGESWKTSIYRDHAGDPCFEVDTQTDDVSLGFSLCGRPERGFIPIIASESGQGESRGSVVLLVTPLRVHRVHLDLGHRHDRDIWPKRVSRAKAHAAGLPARFRYKTLTFRGAFCLRRHTDYDVRGRVYYRSLKYPPCSEQRKAERTQARGPR